MKAIIILGDGMSDHPIEKLGGKTPLMVANKPNIDRLAREGRTGLFDTVPKGLPLGSANGVIYRDLLEYTEADIARMKACGAI